MASLYGAATQILTNDVFAAPTSFFAFASLRQAVRLACFAAASPEAEGAAVVDAAAAQAGVAPAGAAAAPATPRAIVNTQRHTAAARVKDRLLMAMRIAPTG